MLPMKGTQRGPSDAGERCFEDEKGATSHGMQAATRSWKRPGDRFSPRPSRRNPSCCHLGYSLVRLGSSDLQNGEKTRVWLCAMVCGPWLPQQEELIQSASQSVPLVWGQPGDMRLALCLSVNREVETTWK